MKPILFLLLLLTGFTCKAQSLYSVLHLNENNAYKFGRPTTIIEEYTWYGSGSNKFIKTVKLFDNAGMLVNDERFDKDGKSTASFSYTNDTARRLRLSKVPEQSLVTGFLKETTTYMYNKNGFLVRYVQDNEKNVVTWVATIIPDDRGNPIEFTLYDGHGNVFGKEKAEYDYSTNTATNTVYTREGARLGTSVMFFKAQQPTKAQMDNINFNSHGDPLFSVLKNSDGTTVRFEYEYKYDNLGNWIEARTYRVTTKSSGKLKRELSRESKRTITY